MKIAMRTIAASSSRTNSQARGDVDAIAVEVAVLYDHVTKVEADPKR